MPRRYARKSDANQQEIMDALRELGYSVYSVHRVGKGFPDIIVGKRKKNWLIEIKNPEYDKKLTPDEQAFFDEWQGQVDMASTLDEVLEIISECNKKR